MTISTTGFIGDTVLFLRNYLGSVIVDPLAGRTSGFVMTSYPKRAVQYPMITIKAANNKTTKLGMNSANVLADVNIEIRTWCNNSKQGDIITGSVVNVLRRAQFDMASGTSINGIYGFALQSNVPIVEEEGDNSIHSHVMTYNYKTILTG